jgi:UDP-glucose 6-dehydrogenase
MVAVFASKGHNVIGVDVNEEYVEAINDGRAPIEEPGLADLLAMNRSRITATTDVRVAVLRSDIIFVVVPTPSDTFNRFGLDYVLAAMTTIGEALRERVGYRVVVLTSTVMPGAMDREVVPCLETAACGKGREDFGVCYNPEFIALGSVIADMQNPDFVLIGESGERAGQILEDFYTSMDIGPVVRTNFVNAELTKLSLNAYVTTKISYANMLGEICEHIPGADADVVANAVGLDSRIGRKYLKPATAYGGPCVPPGTLVETARGPVPIEEVICGDDVLSHDGRYHIVTETFARPYKGDVITLVAEGFKAFPVQVTPEHPVYSSARVTEGLVRRRANGHLALMTNREPAGFVAACELQEGDMLVTPMLAEARTPDLAMHLERNHIGRPSPAAGEVPFDSDLMYFFGLYLAEGSTWKKEIKLSFHVREHHLAEDVRRICLSKFHVKTRFTLKAGDNGMFTRSTSALLARWLRSTFGTHSHTKCPPWDWLLLPAMYLRMLLRGMWYGDGSNSCERFCWATVSPRMFHFMHLAMLRLGIAHTTKVYDPRVGRDGTPHRQAYFILVGNPREYQAMNELVPYLRMTPTTKGKRTIWSEGNEVLSTIRRIDRMPYDGPVYNLEVAEANSYMLTAGVVHNCFPRDSRAMAVVAADVGVSPDLPLSTDVINTRQATRLADIVQAHLRTTGVVGILGMAYKPDTGVTEESAASWLARVLVNRGMRVMAYDPAVPADGEWPGWVERVESLGECARGADVLVVMVDNLEFTAVEPRDFDGPTTIIDCWGVLEPWESEEIQYLVPGRNSCKN